MKGGGWSPEARIHLTGDLCGCWCNISALETLVPFKNKGNVSMSSSFGRSYNFNKLEKNPSR